MHAEIDLLVKPGMAATLISDNIGDTQKLVRSCKAPMTSKAHEGHVVLQSVDAMQQLCVESGVFVSQHASQIRHVYYFNR